jgi:hypothetical protein
MLSAYSKVSNFSLPTYSSEKIVGIIESDDKFLKKMDLIDAVVAELKIEGETKELIFDGLLFYFFSTAMLKLGEDFFDSKEWQTIENTTIDRGTELMNLLLYLQECRDSGIKYSLDDYLDEYLITEDDFGSEEYEMYEAVIKNREMIEDAEEEEILAVVKQNPDSELGEQLLPVLLFFNRQIPWNSKFEMIVADGENPLFQTALLAALKAF